MTPSSPSLLLLLFLSLLGRPAVGEEEDSTLELVQILYRHGARSPITLYPNDPYGNMSAFWPMGLGQLTKEGKAMQYELGRWLRTRYNMLASQDWVPEEVIIRSTDYDRTLMSAACNLAAFYYPESTNERFEKDLPWTPAPIHTTPLDQDKLIAVDGSCPRVAREVAKVLQLPEIKKITEENQDFFKLLTEKTGTEINNITMVSFLYDTLIIESENNLTLPSWTDGLLDKMKALNRLSFKLYAYTEELRRLRGGPLIKEFADNMKKQVAGQSTKTKMHMFSGHDTTVSTVLESLGVYDNIPPPYAATVLLELHRVNEQHFVKMYYRNDTAMKKAPYPLNLPGCSERCLLDDWLALTSPLLPQDWAKECQSDLPFGLLVNTLAAICVAVLLGVLLLVLVAYNLVSWRRQKNHCAYQVVPSSSP